MISISIIFLSSMGFVPIDDPGTIDRSQLVRILEASWSNIQDLEFVYEGSITHLSRKDRVKPDRFESDYQATFAWRNDNSLHLDLYTQGSDQRMPLIHQSTALFRNRIGERNRVPDDGPSASSDKFVPGGIGSLSRPMSPLRFFKSPQLIEILHGNKLEYSYSGWEQVSSRRCLKLELSAPVNSAGTKPFSAFYWLDMDRDGTPLRYEWYQGPDRVNSVADIKVAQFTTTDGKKVWLPVSGTFHSFLKGAGVASRSPVFEETYSIVAGTVKINQRLADSRFSLDWVPSLPTGVLKQTKARFQGAVLSRGQRKSAQQKIDDALSEADAQSEQLEASAPSRETWIQRYSLSLLCATLGLCVVGLATFLKWKKR